MKRAYRLRLGIDGNELVRSLQLGGSDAHLWQDDINAPGARFILSSLNRAAILAAARFDFIDAGHFEAGQLASLIGQKVRIKFFALKSQKVRTWPIEILEVSDGTPRSLGGGKISDGVPFCRGNAPMGPITIDTANIIRIG